MTFKHTAALWLLAMFCSAPLVAQTPLAESPNALSTPSTAAAELTEAEFTSQQKSADKATAAEEAAALHSNPEPLDNHNTLLRQNKLLVSQNQLLQQELDVLTANYASLAENRSNQFFLFGGILLFLGACLSALLPRLRGRKRFGEWG